MSDNFKLSVVYPGTETDGADAVEISWPHGAPLPSWGETFVDKAKNKPDGSGCYVIQDIDWVWDNNRYGTDVNCVLWLGYPDEAELDDD